MKMLMLLLAICAVAGSFLPCKSLGGTTDNAASLLPSTVLSDIAGYNGKHVQVAGKIQYLEETVSATAILFGPGGKILSSHGGNPYSVLIVCDGNEYSSIGKPRCIRVFTEGHPDVREGQSIVVRGTFSAVKRVGKLTFRNEIEADQILP